MKSVVIKPGADAAFLGPQVLYFSRLIARAIRTAARRLTRDVRCIL
jgi:hypothetical protein